MCLSVCCNALLCIPSNHIKMENLHVSKWLVAMHSVIFCLEKRQLAQLLVFATGSDVVPDLGFEPLPTVTFGHKNLISDATQPFPMANTCTNTLRLPVVESYDIFVGNMMAALTMATTFTCE